MRIEFVKTNGQHDFVGPNLFVERMERCKHYEKKGCFAIGLATYRIYTL
jgi:hypothetical protein